MFYSLIEMNMDNAITNWFFEQPRKETPLSENDVKLGKLLIGYTPKQIFREVKARTVLGYNLYLRTKLFKE